LPDRLIDLGEKTNRQKTRSSSVPASPYPPMPARQQGYFLFPLRSIVLSLSSISNCQARRRRRSTTTPHKQKQQTWWRWPRPVLLTPGLRLTS